MIIAIIKLLRRVHSNRQRNSWNGFDLCNHLCNLLHSFMRRGKKKYKNGLQHTIVDQLYSIFLVKTQQRVTHGWQLFKLNKNYLCHFHATNFLHISRQWVSVTCSMVMKLSKHTRTRKSKIKYNILSRTLWKNDLIEN